MDQPKPNRNNGAPSGAGEGDDTSTHDSSQSKTSHSSPSRSSTMSSSGATRTAAGNSPRRTSPTKIIRGPPRIKVERATEIFEDELAAPSCLRQLEDEGVDETVDASYRDASSRNKRSRRRISRPQLSSSKPNKMCHCFVVGILVQLLIGAVMLIIYMILKRKTHETNSQKGITTLPFLNYSSPVVEKIYLPPPPANIDHFCTMDKIIDPAGRQVCQAICSQAFCCHLSYIDDKSCWKDNKDACMAYGEPCAVLEPLHPTSSSQPKEHTTTVLPNALVLWGNANLVKPAPDQLSEFCAAAAFWGEDMMNSEEVSGASLTCHEICNSARCCWDQSLTNAADRCWTHPECRSYEEACGSLVSESSVSESTAATPQQDDHPVLQPAPLNITEYCQPESIQTNLEELLACQEVCLPAECCWNSALMNQCGATSSNEKCDAYKSTCAVLNTPLEPPSSGTTVQGGGGSGLDEMTAAPITGISTEDTATTITVDEPANNEILSYSVEVIRGACLNHDNAINKGRGRVTLCEQVCQSGSCCFSQYNSPNGDSFDSDTNSCPLYLPKNYCDKFASCHVIFAPVLSNTEQVQQACSNLSDLSDCVKVCAKATCCFTNNPWRACAATNNGSMICEEYSSCEVLYQGMDTQSDVPQGSDRNGNRRNLRAEAP